MMYADPMAKYLERIETGIFRRKDARTGKLLKPLWIGYQRGSRWLMERAGTANLAEARKLRAVRVAAVATGEPADVVRLTLHDCLSGLLRHHELNGRASLRTVRGHVWALTALASPRLRAAACTTDVIERWQQQWQQDGATNATINRRCESLRRALRLAHRAGRLAVVPYVPRLVETGQRGRYLRPTDAAVLRAELPGYVVELLDFALAYGVRKGQLARTLRAWVDRDRGVITYPPAACKARRAHVLVLDDPGRAQLVRLLAAAKPWCPYLFHGPRCAAGRQPSVQYGCVGDFKKAWATACRRAGFPVGRKAGGYTFHATRNTFATDFIAGGGSVGDAMAVGGWKTPHMVSHYDLGDVEALRARLAATRGRTVERLRVVR
jgi:hypothetical protein